MDYFWNYCDKKCLYLQNYLDVVSQVRYEFVVVEFAADEDDEGDKFASCYAVDKLTQEYKLWSEIINNSWY